MPERLTPARLQFNADGVPWSEDFDDVYHSASGGLEQAQAVFMAGNGLPQRWRGRDVFSIVETGFGQGLNFLATWQAWRADPERSARLHFVSVEKHPFSVQDLAQLHAQYPALAGLAAELREHWPLLTPGFHRLHLDGGNVTLTLLFGDANAMLREMDMQADAIYLDGFSPSKNADLWAPQVFRALWLLSKPDTTLASYTVAGHVRKGLTDAGFAPRKAEGFGSKRQRLEGGLSRWPSRMRQIPKDKTALVIGAGLAGCAIAERLAARGWQVTVLEQADQPATLASGNHAGLMHAYFSRDDNLLARLTRAGCDYALRHLRALSHKPRWGMTGILQMAKTDAQEAVQAEIAARNDWPAELLQYLDQPGASKAVGLPVARGGWWFARGIWANPASVCKANLAQQPDRIRFEGGRPVLSLQREGELWQALGANGSQIARAAVVVLAQATAAQLLEQASELPLASSPRSTTLLKADALAAHPVGIAGAGYVTPAVDGWYCIGAAPAQADELAAAQANQAALADLFVNKPEIHPAQIGPTRLCPRPISPDRMPLIGALPLPLAQQGKAHELHHIKRWPGLYGLLGLGSRGLTFASLGAEALACQITAEAAPIEKSIADAIDPARFLLRALRRNLPWPMPDFNEAASDDD